MQTWRDLAACASLPIEAQKAFFGEAENESTEKQHEKARTTCYVCPVQVPCLSYCIETDTDFGVWGGLTESQRKRYLWPALRKYGHHDWVLEMVVEARGTAIFRLIEKRIAETLPLAPVIPFPECSPQPGDRLSVVGRA